jgi:hypothetical protein
MRRIGLPAVRYGLPLAMAVVGIVMLGLGDQEAGFGVVLIGCAGIVLLINTLFRLSIRSNQERAEEERAREEFERTGRWPEG